MTAPLDPARGSPLRLEELGLVGNGQFAAHVGADGDVAWCCLPRFGAEPLLASLLDPAQAAPRSAGASRSGSSTSPAAPATSRSRRCTGLTGGATSTRTARRRCSSG